MIENIKKRFPVFTKNPNLVFFDTAASALKVDSMINSITECYSYEYANIHTHVRRDPKHSREGKNPPPLGSQITTN